MRNQRLAEDYLRRASTRLSALDTLYAAESWADVVRESQGAIELAWKALLRSAGIERPRVHEVSQTLLENRYRLAEVVLPHVERVPEHSRQLRRDRALAFESSEDLTPGEFCRREDADAARDMARDVIGVVKLAFRD